MNKCCFTGHRPKDLPWGYDEDKESFIEFKKALEFVIDKAILNSYTYFITGMAEGFDTIALELLIEKRKSNPNIFIEGAIPCKNQEIKWKKESQERYKKNLKKLDKITILQQTYTSDCMLKRNDYMLEKSDLVIACYKGGFGGTGSTITKAKKQNKKLIIINPITLEIKKD